MEPLLTGLIVATIIAAIAVAAVILTIWFVRYFTRYIQWWEDKDMPVAGDWPVGLAHVWLVIVVIVTVGEFIKRSV